MRFCSVVVCALLASQAQAYSESYVRDHAHLLWQSFKTQYNRDYVSAVEEENRFRIFKENMLKAARFEAEQVSGASFGVGPFADLTESEFKSRHNMMHLAKESPADMFTSEEVKGAQDSIDWRQKGAVTHVKDQARCGSCWAFSAIANIESQWFIAGHSLTSLSEQELVSCDRGSDHGCGGGLPESAFKYFERERHGQVVTEESYPYTSGNGVRGACASDLDSKKVGATIRSHKALPHTEEQMKTFVSQNGPVSIGVDASKFQHYTGGILSNCCAPCRLDHGVAIVGYSTDSSEPYWIIKNSWGQRWGENGYIRVRYGHNECGLNQDPSSSSI